MYDSFMAGVGFACGASFAVGSVILFFRALDRANNAFLRTKIGRLLNEITSPPPPRKVSDEDLMFESIVMFSHLQAKKESEVQG